MDLVPRLISFCWETSCRGFSDIVNCTSFAKRCFRDFPHFLDRRHCCLSTICKKLVSLHRSMINNTLHLHTEPILGLYKHSLTSSRGLEASSLFPAINNMKVQLKVRIILTITMSETNPRFIWIHLLDWHHNRISIFLVGKPLNN